MTALSLVPDRRVIRRSLAEGLLSCTDFQREDGEQLAFGQAWHSFAAAYTLQCQSTREESRQTDVARLAREAWERQPGLDLSRYDEFMELCDYFAASHLANLETLTHIEHTDTLDVGFAILTCTYDRIDRADMGDPDDEARRELGTDYKTEQGEMDHTFQLRWYAQMRLLTHPALEEIGFIVDPVRGRWKTDPVWFTRGDLDSWWHTTVGAVRKRLDIPPGNRTGGPACEGCALRYDCSKAIATAVAIPENEDQADEMFQETLRLEQALTVRKSGLKAWYSDHPARVAVGHEVGFLQPREERFVVTAPPLKVRSWLNRHHMEGDKVLKVDTEMLGRSAIQDSLIVAGLATRERSKPAFKWRNYLPAKKARNSEETADAEGN